MIAHSPTNGVGVLALYAVCLASLAHPTTIGASEALQRSSTGKVHHAGTGHKAGDVCDAFVQLQAAGGEAQPVSRIEIVQHYKQYTSRWAVSAPPVCQAVVKGLRETIRGAPGAGKTHQLTDQLILSVGKGRRKKDVAIPAEFEGGTGKLLVIGADRAAPSPYLRAVMDVLILYMIDSRRVDGDFSEKDIEYLRGVPDRGRQRVAIDWYRRQLDNLPRDSMTITQAGRYYNLSQLLAFALAGTRQFTEAKRVMRVCQQRLSNDRRRIPGHDVSMAEWAKKRCEGVLKVLVERERAQRAR